MATSERHREIGREFLERAEVEYDKGDLLQACEKAWGAVAHYTSSVSLENGWVQQSHYDIRNNARTLIALTNDPRRCTELFSVIEHLHVNFYDDEWFPEEVRIGIDDSKELIAAFRLVEPKLST
jgi:hypothetical protein